jgi:hypothetical protein
MFSEDGLMHPQPAESRHVRESVTVNAAMISYYESPAWNDERSNGSRGIRRPILEKFREERGGQRFALTHAKAIANSIRRRRTHNATPQSGAWSG